MHTCKILRSDLALWRNYELHVRKAMAAFVGHLRAYNQDGGDTAENYDALMTAKRRLRRSFAGPFLFQCNDPRITEAKARIATELMQIAYGEADRFNTSWLERAAERLSPIHPKTVLVPPCQARCSPENAGSDTTSHYRKTGIPQSFQDLCHSGKCQHLICMIRAGAVAFD